jgi:hypothetical protein
MLCSNPGIYCCSRVVWIGTCEPELKEQVPRRKASACMWIGDSQVKKKEVLTELLTWGREVELKRHELLH